MISSAELKTFFNRDDAEGLVEALGGRKAFPEKIAELEYHGMFDDLAEDQGPAFAHAAVKAGAKNIMKLAADPQLAEATGVEGNMMTQEPYEECALLLFINTEAEPGDVPFLNELWEIMGPEFDEFMYETKLQKFDLETTPVEVVAWAFAAFPEIASREANSDIKFPLWSYFMKFSPEKPYDDLLELLGREPFVAQSKSHTTLLHYVAYNNDYLAFAWVAKNFPELRTVVETENGYTPLAWFLYSEAPVLEKLRAECGNDIFTDATAWGSNILHLAVDLGPEGLDETRTAREWLAINFKDLLLAANNDGDLPLHMLVRKRSKKKAADEFVEFLHDNKLPSLFEKNMEGESPLDLYTSAHGADATEEIVSILKSTQTVQVYPFPEVPFEHNGFTRVMNIAGVLCKIEFAAEETEGGLLCRLEVTGMGVFSARAEISNGVETLKFDGSPTSSFAFFDGAVPGSLAGLADALSVNVEVVPGGVVLEQGLVDRVLATDDAKMLAAETLQHVCLTDARTGRGETLKAAAKNARAKNVFHFMKEYEEHRKEGLPGFAVEPKMFPNANFRIAVYQSGNHMYADDVLKLSDAAQRAIADRHVELFKRLHSIADGAKLRFYNFEGRSSHDPEEEAASRSELEAACLARAMDPSRYTYTFRPMLDFRGQGQFEIARFVQGEAEGWGGQFVVIHCSAGRGRSGFILESVMAALTPDIEREFGAAVDKYERKLLKATDKLYAEKGEDPGWYADEESYRNWELNTNDRPTVALFAPLINPSNLAAFTDEC